MIESICCGEGIGEGFGVKWVGWNGMGYGGKGSMYGGGFEVDDGGCVI